jgi:hypothetical protein
MRKILIIIILTIVTINWSCKKDPKVFTVTGQITKKNTTDKISGARVYLDSKQIIDGVYNSNFNNIAHVETNSNGEYSFEVEQSNTELYRFRISKDSYFEIEENVTVGELEANDTYNKDFVLTGESWINLKVKNTMPQSTDDEIDYRYTNIDVSGLDCCDNETTVGIGAEYSDDRLCRTQSDEWIRLEWVVKKNGGQIYNYDSIFTTFGQTIIYNINY